MFLDHRVGFYGEVRLRNLGLRVAFHGPAMRAAQFVHIQRHHSLLHKTRLSNTRVIGSARHVATSAPSQGPYAHLAARQDLRTKPVVCSGIGLCKIGRIAVNSCRPVLLCAVAESAAGTARSAAPRPGAWTSPRIVSVNGSERCAGCHGTGTHFARSRNEQVSYSICMRKRF